MASEPSAAPRLFGVDIARWAQVAFWAALAFTLVMAWLPRPPDLGPEIGDKSKHMLAFATLTILAAHGYPRASLLRLGERLSFLGAMVEVVQSIPALRRDCDFVDWLVDTAVIAGVLVVVWAWRRRVGKRDH